MKKLFILSLFLILAVAISAHPWKPTHYVIIDTDGGMDDLKAINMLLASPDVRVLAIIASGGVMPAEYAYKKVRSLLDSYHHEGLMTGINRNVELGTIALPTNYKWGEEEKIDPAEARSFEEVISRVMEYEKTPICFISLASLNTIETISENHKNLYAGIKEIIWSNDGIDLPEGFNYKLDSISANNLIKKETNIKVIGYQFTNIYKPGLLEDIGKINNQYAKKTSSFLADHEDHEFIFGLVDDMIPVFLHYPEIFKADSAGNLMFYMPKKEHDISYHICKILSGNTVNRNQVFRHIPTDTSFYMPDIQEYMSEIISRHGKEEFEAGVLTNELHRHLGVYAIIGTKMGIRAREYFNTGVDEMNIVSQAGSVPPVSCLNDGLQVSTGATAGHGLLKVIEKGAYPSASFTYMGTTILIRLNKHIANEIRDELRDINYVYGLDSNIYWELVRQKAILYWKNLDRHKVFEITTKI